MRLLFALLLLTAPAAAADRQGRFAVDGAGAAPCTLFLDARTRRDQRYFMFGGWIDGFTSAMNIYERDTFDITPWQSTDLIAAAVAERCQSDRGLTVGAALGQVSRRLMRDRLRARADILVAGDSRRGVPIYADTLRQAQTLLKLPATGRWDARTRDALAAFQRARRVPVTGLPDQVTLYLLLTQRAR